MAGRWDFAELHYSLDNGVSYQLLDVDNDPGTFGVATTLLPAFTTTGAFDNTNTVTITLTQGTDNPPVTMSDADVIAGANGAIIGDEYIQYGTVTNLGSNQYQLSHLLRGRRGTDAHWDAHVIGERAVLDNGGIKRFVLPSSLVGKTILLKAVGNGQTLADVLAVSVHIYGRETREYAAVNLAATRSTGDILATWTRRARKNGNVFQVGGVPLDTPIESYSFYALSAASTSIASITQAAQAVMDVPGHAFVSGSWVYFTDIAGMVELNGEIAQVVSLDAINPNLVTFDLDTSQWHAYTAPPGNTWRARRVITTATPSVTYDSASQNLDFGSLQNPLQCVVTQTGPDGRPGYAVAGFV